MKTYHLRVVARGLVNGVPRVDAYLEVQEEVGRSCLMYATGMSPKTAEDDLINPLGELGIRVERETQPCLETHTKEKGVDAGGAGG